MFEDSTFESTGRIHTRSRGWMAATSLFNGTILFALILIPLIYPEALPRQALSFLLTAPPPPPTPQPPPKQASQPFQGHPEM
jgi:protein TonB